MKHRLADILSSSSVSQSSSSPSRPPVDESAITTVERYGGEMSCLMRFLRARKFDAAAAEKMLRNTVAFRRLHRVNEILLDPEAVMIWKRIRPLWAAAPVAFTRSGNLVVYFQFAPFLEIWRSGTSEDHLRIFYVAWLEHMLKLQAEGRSRLGRGCESEMPACVEVYDLQGVGFSHLRCIAALRVLMRILKIGQDHYPENLHTAVMLNVPALAFKPLKMVMGVLDAGTQAKLRIARDSGHALLSNLLGVTPKEVGPLFGGAGGPNSPGASSLSVGATDGRAFSSVFNWAPLQN